MAQAYGSKPWWFFLLGNPKIDGELMFIPKKDAVGSEPSLYDGMVGEVDSFVSWYW